MSLPHTATPNVDATPLKPNADGKSRYAHDKRLALSNREHHCKEMQGMVLGPMKVGKYMDLFVPAQNGAELPATPKVTFAKVPTQDEVIAESSLYPPLVQ